MKTNLFNRELLSFLVCPVTKEELTYDEVAQELVSVGGELAYPILEGIPVMLPEKARPLKKISSSS